MSQLFPSYAIFSAWLISFTILLGFLGMLSSEVASMFALLPYLLAFYLMTFRFLKVNKSVPSNKQRWQLSIGCASAFWLYSILASLIGLFIIQGKIDFAPIQHAFSSAALVILLMGTFFILNAFLVFLGYWFLGKPTTKIFNHQYKN